MGHGEIIANCEFRIVNFKNRNLQLTFAFLNSSIPHLTSHIRNPHFSIDTFLCIGHSKNFIEKIFRILTGYGGRADFQILGGI